MLEFPILPSGDTYMYDIMSFVNKAYEGPKLTVLFDTGAFLSVWVDGYSSFCDTFPNAVSAKAKAVLSGFGKMYEVVDIYRIPFYYVKDDKGTVFRIQDLYVAVTKRDFSFHMILSFPVFEKLNYHFVSYTDKNGIFKQIKPVLRLYPKKHTYVMSMKYKDLAPDKMKMLVYENPDLRKFIQNGGKILGGVYTFTQ